MVFKAVAEDDNVVNVGLTELAEFPESLIYESLSVGRAVFKSHQYDVGNFETPGADDDHTILMIPANRQLMKESGSIKNSDVLLSSELGNQLLL
jgi:hypothetical protein